MGGDLTTETPAASYKDLLQIDNSNQGVDATLRDVQTGEGTPTALKLADDAAGLIADSRPLIFGAGSDMDIGYDGADGYVRTDLVAPSDLKVDCGANKTIELQAPVYKDINLGAALLSLPAAANPGIDEFKDEAGLDTGIETYAFAVDELVSGAFELQHDYKVGTDLIFHVHWQAIAAPTGTDKLKWQLIYTVAKAGETLDAVTTITVEEDIDTQYQFYMTSFAAITGTNFHINDQFLFQLSRIAASADEFGGDGLIATVGVHYEVNTLGSRTILTK